MIFDRFLVRLGLVLAPFLAPKLAQNRLKIASRRFLRPFLFKNVNFSLARRFPLFFHQNRPQDEAKIEPSSPQDGTKTVLKSFFFDVEICLRFWFVLGAVLAPFWVPFGTLFGTKIGQKIDLKSQDRPKSPQERPKSPQEPPRGTQEGPRGTQKAPKSTQKAPKSTQKAPKSTKKEPKRANRAKRERKERERAKSTKRERKKSDVGCGMRAVWAV